MLTAMAQKHVRTGTYAYFAQKLGIAQITAKKYGKQKCKRLLAQAGMRSVAETLTLADSHSQRVSQSVQQALAWVVDDAAMDIMRLDAKSKELASVLLYDALATLNDLRNSPELSVHQRLQVNLAIAKMIAGAK